MSQHCWRIRPIADPARRIGSEGGLYAKPIGYLPLSLSKIAQVLGRMVGGTPLKRTTSEQFCTVSALGVIELVRRWVLP
jgi:hypothetical protein